MADDQPRPSSDSGPGTGRLVLAAAAGVPVARGPYAPPGYPSLGLDPQDSVASQLFEYWRILNRRKWLIGGIVLATLSVGTMRTLMQTPLYTATVRLQIDRAAAKIVDNPSVPQSEGEDYEFLRTQYELLKSRSMAERVASSLKLGEEADFLKPRDFSLLGSVLALLRSEPARSRTPDKRALEASAAAIVMGSVAIQAVTGSRLVDVHYSDPLPARAKKIANAYADAFIASAIDKRFEANSYAKTFLQDQSQQLKLRLEESERQLLEFSEREQIIVVSEKSSIAENNLAAANAALSNLVAERIRNEQQWRQVEGSKATDLPQFMNNATINALRMQRNALVTDYEEKLQTFKPAYPVMVEIQNKIREIDRQIGQEARSVKAALKGAFEASSRQEAETKKQIAQLRDEVLDLQKRSIRYNILKREVDTNRALYNGLLQRFKEADIAGGVGTNNIFVVDKAVTPGGPSSPNLSRALVLSFALGLGAALVAAFVLEHLDDTVSSAEEMERLSGMTTLGVIPRTDPGLLPEHEIANPRSAISEAYRSLCTSLQFTTDSGLPKTLLVTSSGPGEGKSVTALAIARHFATLGLKVLLIDADLRNPSLDIKLGLTSHIGLSNYLTGGCTPPQVMQATAVANLAFIATGPLPPNAADLLGGPRLLSLLSVGLEVFDLIVVDGPPVMGLADAQLLSNATVATVFVVGAGQARSGAIRSALRRLEIARAPVIGAVLTKFSAKHAGYGQGYGYGYGYGYNYGQAQATGPVRAAERLPGPGRAPAGGTPPQRRRGVA